ncbi:unnamed protein product [Fusarium graminearum]|nr:unnamed protein product [Fusarium graminearum]
MSTSDEDEDEIAPIVPNSHEDEVKKLKRKIRILNKRHNEILDAAKFNSQVAEGKIKDLEASVANLADIAQGLGEQAERSQKLYKEHIEHTAALAATGKDPGEILRPRQPELYDGNTDHLQGFLTAVRSYQMYYPIQFCTDEMRTRHAMSLLKGKAQRLMEPIVRDYVNNPPGKRQEMTRRVYEKYEHFEQELIGAFGLANEKREAETKIRALRQTGAAAAYLAEYRYLMTKLDWNEAANMDQVYLGLKEEVKDALVNIRPKPVNLNELANIIIDIDTQQHERRKEKQANKGGSHYRPNWNRGHPNNNRNNANQGRTRQPDTSYGTQAGPMNIAATQTNRPPPTCWNCGKKGHRERECHNPVKTNQKYRPVPEGRNVRSTNLEGDEPQMVIRSTRKVQWKPVPEMATANNNDVTIAVTRKGKGNASQRDIQPTPTGTAPIDDIPVRSKQSKLHRNDPNCTSARKLVEEESFRRLAKELRIGTTSDPWFDDITPQYNNEGTRRWDNKKQMYQELAREKAETEQDNDIYIRAMTRREAESSQAVLERPIAMGELRRYPASPDHAQISWISCTAHYCELHKQDKINHDCFPAIIKEHTHQKAYIPIEVVGYYIYQKYDNYQVTHLKSDWITRNKALDYIEKGKQVDQWKQNIRTAEELDNERLTQDWRHSTKEDEDRGPTPEPHELRLHEQTELQDWQLARDHQEKLRQENECPNNDLCHDEECNLRHPSQGKDNSLLYCTLESSTSDQERSKELPRAETDVNAIDPKTVNRLKLPWKTKTHPYPNISTDVIPTPGYDLMLGYPWLYRYNPRDIDWRTGQINQMEDRSDDGSSDSETDEEPRSQTSTEPNGENVPKEYHIYEKLFKEELDTKIPQHSRWDHEICLISDDLPFQKIYNLNEMQLTTLREYLDEELRKGNIRISTSTAGFPVMFVPKKNGKLRLIVDYRRLNAITVKDRTPLPLITELKDRLQGKQIFTALDLKGAYNLIRIKEGDEWKTAFRTKFGLFEYLVMPFGLTNAPATFQRMINNVLRQYLDIFVVCYLDDILIFSDNEEEHKEHVHKVLKALQDANLLVEPEKSHFHVTEVDFLGHTISPGEIRMDQKKIAAVKDWPTPTDVKTDFSKIANPLTELTKKDRKFVWLKDAQDAFERLRDAILEEPVLIMFDPTKEIELETDSSDFALGGQIGQRDNEGRLHPIAFYSHKLHGAELNYPIYDKEFLAIVNCFKEFRHYLMGSLHQIKVYTDHQNISHFATT